MNSPLRYLSLALALAFGSSQGLQAGTVTNTADSGAGSLRAVIAAAVNGETINFDSSLNGATITLTSGHLLINNLVVTIDASSLPAGIAVSGNDLQRVLAITGTSDVTLRNLQIRNGRVFDNGGGGNYNGGGIFLAAGNLNMTSCTVRDCFATYNGGGIYLSFTVTATLDRCGVFANTSNSGYGSGIAVAGASTTLFRNCAIAGNSTLAGSGGGLAISNSSPSLVNCTVQGNLGGGIYNDSNSDPVITNTIIWGNSTSGNTASQQLKNITGSNPVVSYSLIQGASGTASFADGNAVNWGSGNLNGELVANNPQFATPIDAASAPHSGGDLRLLAGSTSLDVGNNLAGPGTLDIAGSARIQNTTVDLGAYEGYFVRFVSLYPALDPTADSNHNGISNFQEYGMGFDPTAAGNSTAGPALSSSGGFKFLTINQRPNALDFTPSLVTSTTLASWTAMALGTHYTVESTNSVSSDRKVLVLRLIGADPKRFYRQGFAQ